MAAPSTVAASGYFVVTRAGVEVGHATLRMQTATDGTLDQGGFVWTLTGDPAAKTFHGAGPGSIVDLKIKNRNVMNGTVDGTPLQLNRAVLAPIAAAEMAQSDAGPAGTIKAVMEATPDYRAAVGDTETFWYDFGPVLYRGRLDGTARVLGIASDPGPSECLPFARRALIGDSGQKTQGFFAKLGLTRSYALVNGFAVALRPSQKTKGLDVLKNNVEIRGARHALYNGLLAGGQIQAIIAFGGVAHDAYDLWAASNPAVNAIPVFKIAHPAAVDREASGQDTALIGWRDGVTALRAIVSPDVDGDPSAPNYGAFFTEVDYARIPRWDLPAVAPPYVGDDSWGRAASPRHNNCCERPSPDDRISLELTPPPGQGQFVRYHYDSGRLLGATSKTGENVPVDAFGLPL